MIARFFLQSCYAQDAQTKQFVIKIFGHEKCPYIELAATLEKTTLIVWTPADDFFLEAVNMHKEELARLMSINRIIVKVIT